jgi:Holliday junction resolvase RusA-like endonuclease
MQPETVFVILPLPPRVLSPNVAQATIRGRFAKAAATKKYRRQACKAVQEEQIETAPWGRVEVKVKFFFARKGRHDDENAMVSIKPAYDGFVDAGLVEDDDSEHMRKWPPDFEIDKENPRVELTVTRIR